MPPYAWSFAAVLTILAQTASAQHALHCRNLDPEAAQDAYRAFECVSKLDDDLTAALDRVARLEARIDELARTVAVNDTASLIAPLNARIEALSGQIADLPSGIIIASEDPCNRLDGGWSTYTPATARMIVGAGEEFHPKHQEWYMTLPTGGKEPRQLPSYAAQSGGGELEVVLAEAQMPEHSHQVPIHLPNAEWGLGNKKITVMGGTGVGQEVPPKTDTSGRGVPHPNMPPYIALYFCVKD